ncbi:MAG: hypothetical protein KAU38_04805 [Desulfobacterales bacterium]|nr:hypothetical protein [Desulfobacterales bacterium]
MPALSSGGGNPDTRADSDTGGDGRRFIATGAHGSIPLLRDVPLIMVLGLITAGFVALLRARKAE